MTDEQFRATNVGDVVKWQGVEHKVVEKHAGDPAAFSFAGVSHLVGAFACEAIEKEEKKESKPHAAAAPASAPATKAPVAPPPAAPPKAADKKK
jgi:hypothetical protein